MFGKKPETSSDLKAPKVSVATIPAEFYAGANPTITFKKIEKEIVIGEHNLSPKDKQKIDTITQPGNGDPLHPANLFSNRKFLFISGTLVLIFVVSIGLFYWFNSKSTSTVTVLPAPIVTEAVAPTEEIIASVAEPSDIVSNATPGNPPLASEKIDFPSGTLGSSTDTDADGISDVAEELFTTDINKSDTDGDGHPDGTEIFHLYNPIGKEPERLVDSLLAKEFSNATFGYSVYYPPSWAVGNVNENFKDVLFSTITGENIEVEIFDKNPGQSFEDWFAEHANGEQLSNYKIFTSVFKENGFVRNDELVYFFPTDKKVTVVLYHVNNATVSNYRSVIVLMARSFRALSQASMPTQTEVVQTLSDLFDVTSTIPVSTTTAPATNSARDI